MEKKKFTVNNRGAVEEEEKSQIIPTADAVKSKWGEKEKEGRPQRGWGERRR